jgi:type II secretory pathway component PulL
MGKKAFLDFVEGKAIAHIFDVGRNSSRVIETVRIDLEEGLSPERIAAFADAEESYLSLPLDMLDFRVMELPFNDMKKIREVMPLELDNIILEGSGSVVFDARILKGMDESRILAAYIKKDRLKGLLERLKPLGIDPRIVTSLELSAVLESASSLEELSGLLLCPPILDEKERVNYALRETGEAVINLRTGELAYTADTEKTDRSLRWTVLLVALLFMVFFSDMAFRIITVKKDIASSREAIRKTYQSLFPADKKVSDELYQLKAHMKELKVKENSFIGISPLRILLDLSKLNITGLFLRELNIDRERIILKGECSNLSDVQLLKGKLDGFLTDVTITDAKPGDKGQTAFALAAKGRRAR